jgi:hypothetical protein
VNYTLINIPLYAVGQLQRLLNSWSWGSLISLHQNHSIRNCSTIERSEG